MSTKEKPVKLSDITVFLLHIFCFHEFMFLVHQNQSQKYHNLLTLHCCCFLFFLFLFFFCSSWFHCDNMEMLSQKLFSVQ